MNFIVLTLFTEMIEKTMGYSITGRAIEEGLINLKTIDIRDFSEDKHRHVDDYPYGGGAGMVMGPDAVFKACEAARESLNGRSGRLIYLSPQGKVFDQKLAKELAKEENLIFLCGHYEGIDERVLELEVDDYVSIGDYVLTGGELPSMVMMDTIARLVPGVLNNDMSAGEESFENNLLEYPQYTRPPVFRGKPVPEVLMSGDHAKIKKFRDEQSLKRTLERRPDLLDQNE